MADKVENVLGRLSNSQKIERDKGVEELQALLKAESDEGVRDKLEVAFQNLLEDDTQHWETKQGALLGTQTLLSCCGCNEVFVSVAKEHAVKLLEHDESRVRLAAGEVLGALCKHSGAEFYQMTKDIILTGVKSNLERRPLDQAGIAEQEQTEKLAEKLLGSSPKSVAETSAEAVFHDTAGWNSLETWMKCLQAMIDGCGASFNPYIEQDLLDLVFCSLSHANRFVRETGYYVCGSLVNCNASKNGQEASSEDNAIFNFGAQFADQIAKGLADNWSQVRLAASVAARNFLLGMPEELREKFYSQLLPPLCLNRYYVAEGVRIYNQDTWKKVAGDKGSVLVEKYIKEIVSFYVLQTEADNHAVREAACACIAELASKVSSDVVRPHVATLLDALHVCFKDDSWPVRDASCVACGQFILCFPDESKGLMDMLFPLFYENLQDNIPSVRQGAALSIANVCKAYGMDVVNRVLQKVRESLEKVESQAADSEKYSGLDKRPATYGVVKKLRDNDMELHTNNTMYSCGSLAPKMRRGSRDGGCMDHKFRRPAEPWEMADGCVYLLGCLSENQEYNSSVSHQLPLLAKAANFKHYTQHMHFLESVCKQLPNIANGIGKRQFKAYLEMFLDAIFYAVSCDHALTSSAASQCLWQLSNLLGANILKGRIENYNPRYLETLAKISTSM